MIKVNKIVIKNQVVKIIAIITFLFLFWYALSHLLASYYVIESLKTGDTFHFLSYQYLFLFRVINGLLNVQYLLKIGFWEVIATIFYFISSFSVIEILYLLNILIVIGFLSFTKKQSKLLKEVLLINLLVFIIFSIEFAYFSILAFNVFYEITIDLTLALSIASKVGMTTAIVIFIVIGIYLTIKIIKKYKHHSLFSKKNLL